MSIKIEKFTLPFGSSETHAMLFYNLEKSPKTESFAAFTHGYTSHKASILTWASRLCEEGIPVVLFDLPGHFLGNYSEVESFDQFTNSAHNLFEAAIKRSFESPMFEGQDMSKKRLIIGGHSLGALLSLKASNEIFYDDFESLQILCVGFGLPPQGVAHIFSSAFYKSTLNLRAELISKAIAPELVFPWIKEQKHELSINGKSVYLLTGVDDLVVGKTGAEDMKELLETLGNQVILEKPAKLPHHQPEMAASHIKKFLKDLNYFS